MNTAKRRVARTCPCASLSEHRTVGPVPPVAARHPLKGAAGSSRGQQEAHSDRASISPADRPCGAHRSPGSGAAPAAALATRLPHLSAVRGARGVRYW
jgi:hypothetical protein